MLHRLVKGTIVVFFFCSMNNCFHASVVIANNISFQVQYFKQSQPDAVKRLLNTVHIKKILPPLQKFLRKPMPAFLFSQNLF